MDACEIANFLANELFMQQLVSLDGIHSGVPTRTTATLTPTTLRNIEQTFFELTNDPPITVPCQAGFVPPLPSFSFESETQDVSQDHSIESSGSNSSESWQTPPPSTLEGTSLETTGKSTGATTSKRNMGGRRPKTSTNLTPEEEEKRKVRRERNKLAAARCRKRRVDQTNDLMEKVNALEKEKSKLQSEIQDLQIIKEDLEFCLENHRAQCRLTMNSADINNDRKMTLEFKQPHSAFSIIEKIKVEPIDSTLDDDNGMTVPPPKRILLSTANPIIGASSSVSHQLSTSTISKPSRPSSLNVPLTMTPSQALGMNKNIADIAGVQITTPSTGVMFNFDSLMDGGTGLTPVSQPLLPTSTQTKNPLDLATPTSESKLVSL